MHVRVSHIRRLLQCDGGRKLYINIDRFTENVACAMSTNRLHTRVQTVCTPNDELEHGTTRFYITTFIYWIHATMYMIFSFIQRN